MKGKYPGIFGLNIFTLLAFWTNTDYYKQTKKVPPCLIKIFGNWPEKLIKWKYLIQKFQDRHLFCLFVVISVGSNAVAAYTGNNHACLRHKCFTDNDHNQQTYGSESGPEKIPEMVTINLPVKHVQNV
jgi:hypothetical protein